MSVIGYARTSTLHQDAGLDAQLRQLQALGCNKVFSEQVSSVEDRARLTAALEYVREGDTFVVTKLDRLARSVAHLVDITAELKRKGVALKIVDMGVDTGTPTGRLFLNIEPVRGDAAARCRGAICVPDARGAGLRGPRFEL